MVLQGGWAVAVVVRPGRGVLRAGIAIQGIIATTWLVSRAVGLPFPPDPWVAEPVGLSDAVATGFALVSGALAAMLLRGGIATRRRSATGPTGSHPRRSSDTRPSTPTWESSGC